MYNCTKKIWEADEKFDIDFEKFESHTLPKCPNCKELARPNILMFGDFNWNARRTTNQEARYNRWKKQNSKKKLLVIEIGAGTAISTVRRESEWVAKYYGGKLIRINPRDFQVDTNYAYSVPFGALEGLRNLFC